MWRLKDEVSYVQDARSSSVSDKLLASMRLK